jgi:hypothetical protein
MGMIKAQVYCEDEFECELEFLTMEEAQAYRGAAQWGASLYGGSLSMEIEGEEE